MRLQAALQAGDNLGMPGHVLERRIGIAYDLPAGMEPGLEAITYYDPPNCTFPFGTHVSVVEIDRDTGHVDLVRYVAVDDVGNVIGADVR